MASSTTSRLSSGAFYRDVFAGEHRHPLNVALHIFGVVASAGLVVYAVWSGMYLLALLYPVVHAAPGLIGHRLFERNAAVGDLRITRGDFPLWWFIVGNHVMAWNVLFGGGRFLLTGIAGAAGLLAVGALQNAAGTSTLLSRTYLAIAEVVRQMSGS